MSGLAVQKTALHVPPLEEISGVLEKALNANFSSVSVSVVECPDLSEKPWSLAAPGLCGRARIADVGGVPNLIPLVERDKIVYFDFDEVAKQCELPDALIIGAGAGSSRFVGVNCELMPNIKSGSPAADGQNRSMFAKVSVEDGSCVLKEYRSREFSLLANLFLTEGQPGKVLKVEASCRTGPTNFVTTMREGLTSHFGAKPVGLGGVFLIKCGKAKLHVMPKFSDTPLQTDEHVAKWLKFYEMSAPLTCLSVLVSHDPVRNLQYIHAFFCFP
jgi:hypothetical protein